MVVDPMVKALIADDHGLYRTGLSLLLKDRLGVSEVIEVSGFDDALDRLATIPDIKLALFDLSMPGMGGPESLRVVKETYPDVRVAVVSGSEDRDNVLRAVSVGLNGYVPKSLAADEIASALQTILAGDVYVPRFTATAAPATIATSDAAAAVPTPSPPPSTAVHIESLTPRQRDVLNCVVRGLSNKEIARDLDIAEGTVKIHLAALFNQFGVRNRTELALRAQTLSD
jgi:DNA-binding NarL/FixJ family response regulator